MQFSGKIANTSVRGPGADAPGVCGLGINNTHSGDGLGINTPVTLPCIRDFTGVCPFVL